MGVLEFTEGFTGEGGKHADIRSGRRTKLEVRTRSKVIRALLEFSH